MRFCDVRLRSLDHGLPEGLPEITMPFTPYDIIIATMHESKLIVSITRRAKNKTDALTVVEPQSALRMGICIKSSCNNESGNNVHRSADTDDRWPKSLRWMCEI